MKFLVVQVGELCNCKACLGLLDVVGHIPCKKHAELPVLQLQTFKYGEIADIASVGAYNSALTIVSGFTPDLKRFFSTTGDLA